MEDNQNVVPERKFSPELATSLSGEGEYFAISEEARPREMKT